MRVIGSSIILADIRAANVDRLRKEAGFELVRFERGELEVFDHVIESGFHLGVVAAEDDLSFHQASVDGLL
ncbi:MAG: hypothetical protein BGP12_13535 [Rhodospirillales bacterium 70-18]|nr:MAG: hypothetical protein BGP12_13535 [Rhodospirillales bacterium 70-18]